MSGLKSGRSCDERRATEHLAYALRAYRLNEWERKALELAEERSQTAAIRRV
jgi:hypothetical protein